MMDLDPYLFSKLRSIISCALQKQLNKMPCSVGAVSLTCISCMYLYVVLLSYASIYYMHATYTSLHLMHVPVRPNLLKLESDF